MPKQLYHITSATEWQQAQESGVYQPQGFKQEGFIHCSYHHQLITVANRFFRGQNRLVILLIDSSKIDNSQKSLPDNSKELNGAVILVEENLEGGQELYPHLYSLLPIDAVSNVISFPGNADGSFSLPDELKI